MGKGIQPRLGRSRKELVQKLNLVDKPGYAIKGDTVKEEVCVCLCLCILHRRNENVLYSGDKEGGKVAL